MEDRSSSSSGSTTTGGGFEFDLPDISWKELGHTALDIAGLVPVIGEPADIINGIWYAEGDEVNAGLSFASTIPVVGWGGTATKWGIKGANIAEEFISLYHGTTNVAARSIRGNGIDLSRQRAKTDFGKGFYVTRDKAQAEDWAMRQAKRLGLEPEVFNFRSRKRK